MAYGNEQLIWEGGPSQVLNFNRFVLAVIIPLATIPLSLLWKEFAPYYPKFAMVYNVVFWGMIGIPITIAAYRWLQIKVHKYRITTERFSETYGILNSVTQDLELYRVKDITVYEPLALRAFGCGNLVMYTSDRSTPVVAIMGVRNIRELQRVIRQNVELMRAEKGVVELD